MSAEIKIGLVGLDSSHCVEYAKLLHDATHPHHVAGARIVVAFPGGSSDWELSHSRVEGFTDRMKNEFGVKIVDSIEAVTEGCDAIMILSVDGRRHPGEFEQVAWAGKPVYIDKPLTVSTAEAERIQAVGERTGIRFFSSSVWRFSAGFLAAKAAVGNPCRHAHLHGFWPLFEGVHGWAYYGIHQIEILHAVMGTGCQRVVCSRDGNAEVLTGFWPDGRIGTIATNHDEERSFGGWLMGDKGSILVSVRDTMHDRYSAFLREALVFLGGGAAPVSFKETYATIAFMEAAIESAARAGAGVVVKDYSS